jgi:hypothetical protein
VALTIINPNVNPILPPIFVAPQKGGPNPLDIRVTLSWVSSLHMDNMGFTHTSYSIHVKSITHNVSNTDVNHQHIAVVHAVLSPLVIDTATSGHDQIDFLIPRLYYDRLVRSHVTLIKYKITVTDNIDNTFQNDQVWIQLYGPPHRHLNAASGHLAHIHRTDNDLSHAAVVYGDAHEAADFAGTINDHGSSGAVDFWI